MILVTGATGNVGKFLVEHLVAEDVQIRILVRDPEKAATLGERVESVVGDLNDPGTLETAMRGVDRLYIVTPDSQQVNNVLEAARKAGVSHVVKQSTIEANRSLGPGKWHREQEERIESMGFSWTFLRPTMLMANTIEWWSATIKSQDAVYFPGGKGEVPAVAPADVAAVASRVLLNPGEHAGQIYELTGPQPHTMGEMVNILGTVLGKRIRYVQVPVFLAAIWMRRSGLPGYVVKGLMETLGALRRNEYAYVTDTVGRVGRVKPQSFTDWCCDHLDAFR
jgi:uncharacterized protein YbjT (DUF2867 family)